MSDPIRRPTSPLLLTLLLLAGILLLGGGPAAAQDPPADAAEPILLRWTWTEGETIRLRYTTETESTIASSMVPEPISTTGSQTIDLSQEVTEVSDDGVATVRLVYDSIAFSMQGPGGEEMTWSSDDPPAEAGGDEGEDGAAGEDPLADLGGLMGSMVGQPITLKLDERGELLAVDGFDELWDRMAASLEDHPMAEYLEPSLEQMFSEDTVREMIAQGMVSFPADPVAPGDTWTRDGSYEVPVVGHLAQRQTYRLERLDGDHAVLSLEGRTEASGSPDDGELPLPPEVAEMMDFQMEIRSGSFQGEIRFDRVLGQLDRHEMTGAIEMTMTMTPKTEEAQEMIPEPMVMDITTSFRTAYERIGRD